MDTALLAAEGLDWIEGVVVLVIIALSALGSIAKPLIKKFGGKDPDELRKRQMEQPVERRAPARPAHPPARPTPARPRLQPAIEPPVAQARPARPVPPSVARPAPPTPRRPVPRPTPSQSVRPRPKPVANSERDLSERHLAKLESTVTERHLKTTPPSEDVVHPATEAAHAYEHAVSGIDEEMEAIRRPTRAALRRAIVMNEILGPPVGLRRPGYQS
jgi:hypothetical protein